MRLKLKRPSWLEGRTIVGALIVGALLHIVATLSWANLTASRAYETLAAPLPVNRMLVTQPVTAARQMLPFQTPDLRVAACRYDTTDGPIAIRASLPGLGWSLSLHGERGDNFFVVMGQEGRRTELALLLVPQGEEFVPLPGDAVGPQAMAQVPLQQHRGIAFLRGPVRGPAYRAEVEAELARASCTLRTR